MRFSVEQYSEVIEEMRMLYPMHWAELSHDKEALPLDIDYGSYQALADTGRLLVAVAREDDELAGYHIFILKSPITSKSAIVAYGSLIYLKPKFRKGFNGVRFLKFAEQACKIAGAEGVYISSTTRRPFGKVLEWLGFSEVERTYFKGL